jgi:dCMP deaminase
VRRQGKAEVAAFARELLRAYGPDTSSQEGWSQDEPLAGQGAASALLIQDRFGGDILVTDMDGEARHLNRLPSSVIFDATLVQAGAEASYGRLRVIRRSDLVSGGGVKERYDALRRRVLHFSAMEAALASATDSPDPSTQNGATALDRDGNVVASDCNRFPDGVAYSEDRWERPIKYSFIEHAERNAIFAAGKAGRSLEGGTLVVPWAACADCARAIVQAGVRTLVRLPLPGARWAESIAIGDTIMAEAGVEIIELSSPLLQAPPLRHNGQVVDVVSHREDDESAS